MLHFSFFKNIFMLIPFQAFMLIMLHFAYFICIFGLDGRITRPNCLQPTRDDKMAPNLDKVEFYLVDR